MVFQAAYCRQTEYPFRPDWLLPASDDSHKTLKWLKPSVEFRSHTHNMWFTPSISPSCYIFPLSLSRLLFLGIYLVSFHCSCHTATHCIWAARFCVQLWGMKANITSCIESDCSGHVGHIELRRGAVSLSAAEKQFQQLFKVAPSRWLFQNILLIRYLLDI